MLTEDFLTRLLDSKRTPASSRLLNLSALTEAEAALFRTRWADSPDAIRSNLIERLVDIAEENTEVDYDAIYRIALDDLLPGVRIKAIEGLWECRDRWFLNRLITLAQEDPVEEVRAAAAGATEKFVVLGVVGELRESLLAKLEHTLKQIISSSNEAARVRRRAIEALSPSDDPAVNDIIRIAYHGSDQVLRLAAIYAIGQHCDPGWLPVLLAELKSTDPELRFEAARACGNMEDERAVPSLIELTQDEDSEIQEAAIEALGHIGGDAARRALRMCLQQSDPRVREAAEAALEELSFGEDPLRS